METDHRMQEIKAIAEEFSRKMRALGAQFLLVAYDENPDPVVHIIGARDRLNASILGVLAYRTCEHVTNKHMMEIISLMLDEELMVENIEGSDKIRDRSAFSVMMEKMMRIPDRKEEKEDDGHTPKNN